MTENKLSFEAAQNYWPFSIEECLEILVPIVAEKKKTKWHLDKISVCLETFAIHHANQKNVENEKIRVLIDSIASALDGMHRDDLRSILVRNPAYYSCVVNVLKTALLSHCDHSEITQIIYASLPRFPTEEFFDAFVMYQLSFKVTNRVLDWSGKFAALAKQYGWSSFNRLQLKFALSMFGQYKGNGAEIREEYLTALASRNEANTGALFQDQLDWLSLFEAKHARGLA